MLIFELRFPRVSQGNPINELELGVHNNIRFTARTAVSPIGGYFFYNDGDLSGPRRRSAEGRSHHKESRRGHERDR